MSYSDVIIIGAGAAGLMCAAEAGKRGRSVLVLDQSTKAGNKIRMSGGGRCNFTNYDVGPEYYLSHNPHFVKSSLSRFTQWDFISLVERYHIPWHERDHGQLFCNDTAKDILDMLLAECRESGVILQLKTTIESVERNEDSYTLHTSRGDYRCDSLVIATGGLSIPSMGSSPFGYRIAEQFGIRIWPPSAGLVPFTLQPEDKERLAPLSGIAVDAVVEIAGQSFHENVLFTHRGLSGPAILQASNYWHPGQPLTIDWLPGKEVEQLLETARQKHPKQQLKTLLGRLLPARLVAVLLPAKMLETPLAQLGKGQLQSLIRQLHHWQLTPGGTEGYRTAEITRGGVDCNAVSSKTMEAKTVPGLYFIGEVLDVTGWLGGYNFQWAWSSGWCAGQYV
ncbi:MAG: NAD(P)/FAD-dependent oxidoreductase [Gammaproteobacteria bacterium]|nr:NAD(P)/FAD-dependent oxidoreductase [Gammaproteobacteria bacterium]MCW8972044.1 NAD(P)/FAD-dependent oxidoreductase [Gammaproteobacteria bacterium]MCW8993190.1 NAD(P)/FAD-dependent oxidoreductase [Gammaproteobacteria bacterium]